ncbi:MAG: hypothetical protein M1826_005273 [Phylliscum demangeonii]|nr:MAG: hypothetical protein M1826_005273 [Phylliscum demangeonii]
MTSTNQGASGGGGGGGGGGAGPPPSMTAGRMQFEQQRAELRNEIALLTSHDIERPVQSLHHALQGLNKLNRNLEGVISVGNEFSSVEALWSQFENVMSKDAAEKEPEGTNERKEDEEGGQHEAGADANGGTRSTTMKTKGEA